MNREDIAYMAWTAGFNKTELAHLGDNFVRLAELVAAAENEAAHKRRGVLMFNPYTGTPRHPSDIASDPHGILLIDHEQRGLQGAKP